jgi:hypothetical protein
MKLIAFIASVCAGWILATWGRPGDDEEIFTYDEASGTVHSPRNGTIRL